jgi:hypothetical protein
VLTNAICDNCLNNVNDNNRVEFDKNDFILKTNILNKYLESNYDKELECLKTVYELIEKLENPPGKKII